MLVQKKSIDRQKISVAATRELGQGVGTRHSAPRALDLLTLDLLAPGILSLASRRRPDGEIRLIDLERRARFSRPTPDGGA